jgi:hypothetical protein
MLTVLLGGWLLGACLQAQERTTLLVTFDTEKIGPAVACDGQFRCEGGQVVLRPWLHEDKDTVQGASYRLRTEHDAQTAQAAGLAHVRRCSLTKGLIVEVTGADLGTVECASKLGDFQIPLQQLRQHASINLLDGKVRAEWIPNVDALTGDQAEEEYPSVAVLPDGRTAVAYVAWDGKQDGVVVRIGDQARVVTTQAGDYMEPRCAVDGQGKLWVIWAANDGRQWDLWAECDGRTVQLTRHPLNDFWPRVTRDGQGQLWLAWQTVAEDLHYEILLARLGPQGLEPSVNVSQHAADDWEPALCATPDGRIVVAWDTYRNGSFDVYLREFAADSPPRPLGPERVVAATAQREAHATVAADSHNRVWIAWEVANAGWGKHPQLPATLHQGRRGDLACFRDGRLFRPEAGFAAGLPEEARSFVEYPQVAVDGKDRLWIVFRVQNRVLPFWKAAATQRLQNYGMWHLFATHFDGQAWSPPMLLARSDGRQDMRVDVARDGAGQLRVAFGADGRVRSFPYVPVDYDVFLATLPAWGAPAPPPLAEASELGQIAPVPPDPELDPLPRRWALAGKDYRLVLGDTHRHTDISRCSNGYDGSLQDAYRYAVDACGLDWLAISDHDQDILKHRNDRSPRARQDYDWWRSQKYCDVYTIPGRFVALYGYEHGGSYQARGGHKNVMLAQRGSPVEEVDAPHELFAALAGSGAVAIPHQLADAGSRTDWDKWNTEYERVAEVFQTRGSYEFDGCPRAAGIFTAGNSLWDALAKGVRIGIIASSDHGQTHQARAGVYVADDAGSTGFSRDGILAALRARRTFGATIAASLQVRIGPHAMGEEIEVDQPPTLDVRVAAPAEMPRVAVIRDGRFLYTHEAQAKQAAFEFQDLDLKPGQAAYYYVRAQVGENDYVWSSPLWVTRKK